MLRVLTVAGAAIVAWGALSSGAEAKKITYEVNGERFSYSTNNREQTLAARRHIEAANAAAAAKAKADAEKASNPLVAVFGSATQREATQAQSALEQARPGNGAVAVAVARVAPESAAAAEPARPRRVAKRAPVKVEPDEEETATETAAAPTEPVKVKSVSYDAMTGIKTTFMTDGSIHEEPFDGTTLSSAADPATANSLNAFVEQLRPVGQIETTGSTWTAARPETPLRPKSSHP